MDWRLNNMKTQTENPMVARVYTPAIGTNVKLRLWNDYASRGITMWSWFRVLSVFVATRLMRDNDLHPCGYPRSNMATLQQTDGGKDVGVPIEVPLTAIEPPLGWKPTYDIYVS